MQITMKDSDGFNLEVGYELIDRGDGQDDPLFWLESSQENCSETVTVHMTKKQLDQLASAIQFLKGSL